jgi:hypothetical protein
MPELAVAGVLAGLWQHPLGVAAACGMAVLLAAALFAYRRTRDDIKTLAPALAPAMITAAYPIIALTRRVITPRRRQGGPLCRRRRHTPAPNASRARALTARGLGPGYISAGEFERSSAWMSAAAP